MQPEVDEEKVFAFANKAEEWCKSLECPEQAFGALMCGLAFDNLAYAEKQLAETIQVMEDTADETETKEK